MEIILWKLYSVCNLINHLSQETLIMLRNTVGRLKVVISCSIDFLFSLHYKLIEIDKCNTQVHTKLTLNNNQSDVFNFKE